MKKWLLIAWMVILNFAIAEMNQRIERIEEKLDGTMLFAINLNEPTAKTFLLTASEATDQSVRLRLAGNFEKHGWKSLLKEQHLLIKSLGVRSSKGEYLELYFKTKRPMAYLFVNQGQRILLKIQAKMGDIESDVISVSGDLPKIMDIVTEHSGLNTMTKINRSISSNFSTMNIPKHEWLESVKSTLNLSTQQYKSIQLISDIPLKIPEVLEDTLMSLNPKRQVISMSFNSISSDSVLMLISDYSGRAMYGPRLGNVVLHVKDAPWSDVLGALAIIENKSLKIYNNVVFMNDWAQIKKWEETGCYRSKLWQEMGSNLEGLDNYYAVFKVLTDRPESLLAEVNQMIQEQSVINHCQILPVFHKITLGHMQSFLKWKRTQDNEYDFAYINIPILKEKIQQIVDKYTENYLLSNHSIAIE